MENTKVETILLARSHLRWRQQTTRCIWGKGLGYQGTLDVDKNGDDCQPGTFCRNKDGLFAAPSCNSTASNAIVECQIISCERVGEFAGSRGSSVRYVDDKDAYTYGQEAFNREYESANFEIIDSSYFSGSERKKWTGQFNRDHYSARSQFFFLVPRTGWYKMIFSHDAHARPLRFNNDGSYETLYNYESWSTFFRLYRTRSRATNERFVYGERKPRAI